MAKKTIIIGASGKKQSGKNTLCDDLFAWLENKFGEGCVKMYSYADALKEKVCMEVMGLTKAQCYGTDEQKNTPTMYEWENVPRDVRYRNRLGEERAPNGEICKYVFPKGYMTAREIMQIVGTDIFRKYFNDSIWVNATFRNIKNDGYSFALISDVRFPSEIDGIVKEGGIVLRLLRDICEADCHSSETALDDYDWDSIKNAHLIDNREMSIIEQNEVVRNVMDAVLISNYGEKE